MNYGNTNTRTFKKFSVWGLLIIFALSGILIYPKLLWAQQITKEEATEQLLSVAGSTGVEEVTRLIKEGADVNVTDKDRETPLMYAARGNTNPEVLRVLIEGGADVSAVNRNGRTPLMRAARYNSNPEVLRLLIERGADVNAVDNGGWTILMYAAVGNSNPEVLRILIEGGANVNAVDDDKYETWTPLMLAAYDNVNPEVLRVLIEGGADVNFADYEGKTPLSRAASHNPNPEVLRVLIEKGDKQEINKEATEELLSVMYEVSVEEVARLILAGADVNAVVNAVDYADVDSAADYGDNLFWYTVSNPAIMRLLISAGADIVSPLATQETKEEATKELLTTASDAVLDRVFSLIRKGADVNAVDEYGWTPLMLAAMDNQDFHALLVLIGCGANVNAVDSNGWTALMLATWNNSYFYIARLLVDFGADVDMADNKGRKAEYNEDKNALIKEIYAYRHRGITYTDGTDLALYHPWGDNSLARLDSPASLRISGDYPKLDGRTSAYPIYAAVANEVYEVSNKEELKNYLRCSATEGAYDNIIDGKVDIAFLAKPSDEQLQRTKDAGLELHFTPLAKDAFVFIVNDRNPVANLSIEQIRDIYLGKITNWREVGGNDRGILPFQRQPNSSSQTVMEKDVMQGEELPLALGADFDSMGDMVVAVAQYRDQEESIGYSFRFYADEMVRIVMNENKKEAGYLSQNPADSDDARVQYLEVLKPVKLLAVDGIEPSVENIRNGTYPFTIDVYAVTTGESNPRSQELIDWMTSPQGQELIEKTGFVGAVENRK